MANLAVAAVSPKTARYRGEAISADWWTVVSPVLDAESAVKDSTMLRRPHRPQLLHARGCRFGF